MLIKTDRLSLQFLFMLGSEGHAIGVSLPAGPEDHKFLRHRRDPRGFFQRDLIHQQGAAVSLLKRLEGQHLPHPNGAFCP